ncbi:30S ribosomal protein S1 [Methyloligella sp. 2.7D]|uniref:30S ribosomal protein S1 n=1 Tax=unclassified Methyloligella TaxID=2625955 RepID=UPI00157C8D0F|nr:30S ribosomal protein S1 [Methyloligella sp. GL2]QKP76066.1 30S ribosomal protein S1 [Methyloligella sp. GL2]
MSQPQTEVAQPSHDEFAALLEESLSHTALEEGTVVKGTVVGIEKDVAVIDVGLKTEGRVALKEFGATAKSEDFNVGDEVDVYLERVENALGEAVLSREKARREESWVRLEEKYKNNERVEGIIFNRVKGGFTVDLDGAVAFLPGSQVDIRPVRDVSPLMNMPQPFQILKMDRRRGNIVVSRRSVLEETRAEKRSEIVGRLEEGQVIEGVVKNITDYGAFIDLGGIDGLLHVTDMAWRRVSHPSEIVTVGDTVKVQIIRINTETQRISLGIKQLEADPWEGIASKYPVGARFQGTVTNITDYGAFVELEPGVEGLIHVSEMSWTKKNVHPGKIISTSQQVEVQVLEVDPVKRRISLGLKQTQENPWSAFADSHPAGTEIEGEIRNITEFGLFIGLEGGIDGMVHLSDLDWSRSGEEALKDYKKGDMAKAVVLEADPEKERISLGIKQLGGDPFQGEGASGDKLKKGARVTCEVTEVKDNGLEVKLIDYDLTAFVRRSDLSRERSEQRPDRFAAGEKFDAVITQFDPKAHKVGVSIKALEIAEEKEAVAQYGSTDSGASLGDILGAALNKAKGDDEPAEEEAKPKRKTKAKAEDEAAEDEGAAEEAPAEDTASDEEK